MKIPLRIRRAFTIGGKRNELESVAGSRFCAGKIKHQGHEKTPGENPPGVAS
jgi:hypothetical protein